MSHRTQLLALPLLLTLAACGSLDGGDGSGSGSGPAPGAGGAPAPRYGVTGSEPSPLHLAEGRPVEVTFTLAEPAPPGGLLLLPAAQPADTLTFPATQVRFDGGATRSRPVVVVPGDVAAGSAVDLTLFLVSLQHGESTLPARVYDEAAAPADVLAYARAHAADPGRSGGVFGR